VSKPFDINAHNELSENLHKSVERMLKIGGDERALNPSEASDRVAWIAALFYIKWVEFQDREQEAISTFNGESYEPLIPASIRELYSPYDQSGDVLHYLHTLYLHINSSNNPKTLTLKRVFSIFDEDGEYSVRQAQNAEKILNGYDFTDPTQIAAASELLESLIYTAAEKSRAAEYYTPKSIVELMVDLAAPKAGELIYDPCFGAGGLLVESAKRIKAASKTLAGGQWEQIRSNSIYGIEWNEHAFIIALSRIVLAGIPEPGLELANALMRPRGGASFDVVLACPPWGQIDNEIRESLQLSYNVPARDWSNLFVQHTMQVLKPGGRAVVAVPEGLLFGSGPDQQLRKWLLEEFRIDGIVSLPEGSFAPYTGIKSSLVLFRREAPVESVYFYQVQKLAGTNVKVAAKEEKAGDIAKRFSDRETGSNSWVTPVTDLMKRNCELVAKKTGDDQLQKWLNKICSAETGVQKLSLQQVSVVATGIKYDRRMATENQSSEDDIRLIRISDIREGIIGRPSLFISKDSNINTDLCLRSSDILLSKTGTIGKMALVHPEAVQQKTTATQSLIIVRHNEKILPEYLYALLTSASYRQWLEGHARGATIQHLPTETLKHLPLPVPELLIQDRVIKELKQRKDADPLALVADIILEKGTKKQSDGLEEITYEALTANLPNTLAATSDAFERVRLAASTYLLLSKIIPENDNIYLIGDITAKAVKPLQNLDKLPKGTALYAMLSKAKDSISYLDYHIEYSRPLQDDQEAINFIDKLNSYLTNEIDIAIDVLKNVGLVPFTGSAAFLTVGLEKEIIVTIHNPGYLPLIDITIEIEPFKITKKWNFLNEQGTQDIAVTIPKQNDPGKLDVRFNCSAKHIDGSDFFQISDIALEVRSIRDASAVEALGSSPYVTGSPIEANRPDMFFGRKEIIDSIKRQLPTSHRANIVLLEGNRRSGKTSILNQLKQLEKPKGWIPVYCNFQGGTGDTKRAGLPTHEIYKLLTKCIFEGVFKAGHRTWFPDMEMPDKPDLLFKAEFAKIANQVFCDDNAFEKFELYLQSVLRITAPNRLLLMLDEFDKIQEGIDTGITSPQVPENLRYILHTYPDTTAILSYSKILRKLRNEYWSMLFGLGHQVTVGALEEEDAKLLVTQPAAGKLIYTDNARDKIINLCARQPFIIQQLCNTIFDRASETGQRSISESMVDEAAARLSSESEHFRTLWDHHVESERRRFLLSLCEHLQNGPDPITFSLLENKLLEAKIYAKNLSQVLKDDIDHLRALDLISMHDKGRYSLTIPLMASWIQQNIDFEGQKRLAQNESQENL